jgi:hypothetical protein
MTIQNALLKFMAMTEDQQQAEIRRVQRMTLHVVAGGQNDPESDQEQRERVKNGLRVVRPGAV